MRLWCHRVGVCVVWMSWRVEVRWREIDARLANPWSFCMNGAFFRASDDRGSLLSGAERG